MMDVWYLKLSVAKGSVFCAVKFKTVKLINVTQIWTEMIPMEKFNVSSVKMVSN